MKRGIAWAVGIVAVIAYIKFVGMSHAGECKTLEVQANQLIASLQRCEVDTDCTFERLTCPFPCNTPLHREGKEQVIPAINAYNKQCMMMCPECQDPIPSKVSCVNNTCTLAS